MPRKPRPERDSISVPWSGNPQIDLLAETLDSFLTGRRSLASATQRFLGTISLAQRAQVDEVLNTRDKSYPPGLLIQLSYALAGDGRRDITVRHEGARGLNGVSGKLGKYLSAHHIMRVPDAFQNIGKNSTNLVRGNFPAWDGILTWASGPHGTRERLEAVFEYACATLAARARPVLPLPELNLSALTFGNVMTVFRTMLATPSEGAHEQFIVAALLHALVQQTGSSQYRVETKSLTASDLSGRAAGDVQILMGNQLLEAYEVTGNDWSTKLTRVSQTLRDHDLTRLHVVASVRPEHRDAMLRRIADMRDEVTVVEVDAFVSTLTAALRRQFRGVALVRLYEYLDRLQPVVERVNSYVGLVSARGLIVPPAS